MKSSHCDTARKKNEIFLMWKLSTNNFDKQISFRIQRFMEKVIEECEFLILNLITRIYLIKRRMNYFDSEVIEFY